MPLSDTAIRNAKPKDKPYKLTDERGLYLLINPAGKYWRLDYRFEGKRKTLALGVYPDVSLKDAREKRDEARKQLAAGIDPGAQRKATKAADADTFEAIAREWINKRTPTWAPGHAENIVRRLEQGIFPWLGAKPIREIAAPDLLAALRRIEERGAMACSILNEQGWNPDAIERQLAHAERSKVRAAYLRSEYLDERRRMMQAWADYLDGLKNGAEVIAIQRAK